MDRHPSVESVVRWFRSDHLSDDLAAVVKKFETLKDDLLEDYKEDSPELTDGLKHLRDAKDAFVRVAVMAKDQAAELVKDVTE